MSAEKKSLKNFVIYFFVIVFFLVFRRSCFDVFVLLFVLISFISFLCNVFCYFLFLRSSSFYKCYMYFCFLFFVLSFVVNGFFFVFLRSLFVLVSFLVQNVLLGW